MKQFVISFFWRKNTIIQLWKVRNIRLWSFQTANKTIVVFLPQFFFGQKNFFRHCAWKCKKWWMNEEESYFGQLLDIRKVGQKSPLERISIWRRLKRLPVEFRAIWARQSGLYMSWAAPTITHRPTNIDSTM